VDGYIALKHPAPGSLFWASELRQDAMLPATPAAGFATVPVAGKDCVELEHADKAAERTAMAVSRVKFNASTFPEHSAIGCKGLRRMGMAHLQTFERRVVKLHQTPSHSSRQKTIDARTDPKGARLRVAGGLCELGFYFGGQSS
jgi:hypothetical protein